MPRLISHVSEQEYKQQAPRQRGVNLDEYRSIVSATPLGSVARVGLDEGESPRTTKRRFSLAAAQEGLKLTWRTAPDGEIAFTVSPVN